MNVTFKTTLKCGTCLRKITPGLERIGGLRDWSVDLEHPDRLLTADVENAEVSEQIESAVREAGFETTPVGGDAAPATDAEKHPQTHGESPPAARSIRTYWPLILVLLYVLAGTAYIEWIVGEATAAGGISPHRAMSSFMGLFFLAFAFFKLLDVPNFADAFSAYDLLARRSRLYAMLYPFIELALGIAYLLALVPLLTHLVTVAVMGLGLVGVIRVVSRGQTIQCACLGTVFNLPMSAVTIVENSTMIVMALVMIFFEIT